MAVTNASTLPLREKKGGNLIWKVDQAYKSRDRQTERKSKTDRKPTERKTKRKVKIKTEGQSDR